MGIKIPMIGLFISLVQLEVAASATTASLCNMGLLGSAYQQLLAEQKADEIWERLSNAPYEILPSMTLIPEGASSVGHLSRVASAASRLGMAFDHVGDEMPADRVKVIHQYGAAAMVEWVPVPGHPYSGLFRSGAMGVTRLSLGLAKESVGSFVPGMAIKLLVDGQPSKNLFAMQRLEGQGQDNNFFAHPFTNTLPAPVEASTQWGVWYFERFVTNAIALTVDHVARMDREGLIAQEIVSPEQLIYVPNSSLAMDSNNADFRAELLKIPSGTVLYEVYSVQNDGQLLPIASLVTRSEFVASRYGDEVLYFQHEGTPRRTFWWGNPLDSE